MSPFIRPRPLDDPALRLIGFHHAGGSAAVYHPLVTALPEDWDLLLLDLPGRGKRHSETPIADMDALVARVVEDVRPWTDVPFALFGHSLGAIVCAEVGRSLESLGTPPAWVGVSGRVAPDHHAQAGRGLSGLDDDALLDALFALGGLPARIHEVPEFVERFLRTCRADLRAVETYRPRADRDPLRCPVTAFGGSADAWAPRDMLAAWSRETTGPFRQLGFPGGHFYFLGDAFPGFADQLVAEVREMTALVGA